MKKPINTFNAFVEDKDKDQKLIKKIEEYALKKMTDDFIPLESEGILLNPKDDSSNKDKDQKLIKEIGEYTLKKMTDDLISLKSESILLNYKDDFSFEPINIRMKIKRK